MKICLFCMLLMVLSVVLLLPLSASLRNFMFLILTMLPIKPKRQLKNFKQAYSLALYITFVAITHLCSQRLCCCCCCCCCVLSGIAMEMCVCVCVCMCVCVCVSCTSLNILVVNDPTLIVEQPSPLIKVPLRV